MKGKDERGRRGESNEREEEALRKEGRGRSVIKKGGGEIKERNKGEARAADYAEGRDKEIPPR